MLEYLSQGMDFFVGPAISRVVEMPGDRDRPRGRRTSLDWDIPCVGGEYEKI